MSDPRAKAERSAAKDARQEPAPDTPVGQPRRKKSKPWSVEERYTEEYLSSRPERHKWFFWKDWRRVGRYADRETAEAAIAHFRTQYFRCNMMEWRIVYQGQVIEEKA